MSYAQRSVALLLALILGGCQASTAPTGSSDPVATAEVDPGTVAGLGWLTGTWRGPAGERQIEEQWSQTTPGSIAALVRFFDDEQTSMLELVSISDEADGLTLRLQQWSAQFEPRSKTPQTMRMVAAAPGNVRFEASSPGGLKQLQYQSPDSQTLIITVTTVEGNQIDLQLSRVPR